jgi:hypothetical protein
MKYAIVIQDEAIDDAIEVWYWYESQQPGLGDRFEADLEACYNYQETNHQHFQMYSPPFRKAHLNKFPYSVAYEIREVRMQVIVFAVHAQKDDPKKIILRIMQQY